MSIIAWNCRGLGSFLVVRTLTDEVRSKDPLLVFLAEMKASTSRIKGIQTKLEYTQGIVVPSDGQSGDLAMLWKEGDVIVCEDLTSSLWRVTGFYGQPETEKRVILWQLLEALKA